MVGEALVGEEDELGPLATLLSPASVNREQTLVGHCLNQSLRRLGRVGDQRVYKRRRLLIGQSVTTRLGEGGGED